MKKDTGGMGEHLLGVWAAQIGITANQSANKDATGWDWFLEWPIESLTPSAVLQSRYDKAPSPVKCLVQVKSTNSTQSRVDVKLSNWFFLIHNPLPSFYLILDFGGENECQRAFLVHVGPDLIAKVQKRLVDIYPDGNLNKKTMRLKWSDEELLPSYDGDGLEKAVMSYVLPDMDQYVKNKHDLIKTVGYEGSGQIMQVTINIPQGVDPEEHMMDFDLGIIPKVRVEGGTLYEERFGKRISQSDLEEGSFLEVTSEPVGSGEVIFTDSDLNKAVVLDCQVYIPAAFGHLIPKEKIRARFSHRLMEFIIPLEGEGQRFNFTIRFPDNDEFATIKDLNDLARIVLLISEAAANSHELLLSARFQNSSVRTGKIDASSISPTLISWAKLVHYAFIVARHFEMENNLSITSHELLSIEGPLLALAGILDPQRRDFKVTFCINEAHVKQGEKCGLPMVAMTKLGQRIVGIAATLFGTINLSGDSDGTDVECEVVSHDIKIEDQYQADVGDIVTAKKWSEEQKVNIIKRYKNEMLVVDLHD
ncbi:MAG: hypothetical protein ACYCWB_15805 [Thiobacillus sp.]